MGGHDVISYPLAVAGGTTRVLEAGRGGLTVILVHGAASHAGRFLATLPALARRGFHAVAIDLPGHGFATPPEGFRPSIQSYASFLSDAVAAVAPGFSVLIGSSFGGQVTAWAAAWDPGRLGAVVLCGSTGLAPLGAARRAAVASRMRDDRREAIGEKLRLVFGPRLQPTEGQIDEEWRMNMLPANRAVQLALADHVEKALDDHLAWDALRQVKARRPVLLLWGERDQSIPLEIGRASSEALSLPLMVLAGAGHCPFAERPEEFADCIEGFLDDRSIAATDRAG